MLRSHLGQCSGAINFLVWSAEETWPPDARIGRRGAVILVPKNTDIFRYAEKLLARRKKKRGRDRSRQRLMNCRLSPELSHYCIKNCRPLIFFLGMWLGFNCKVYTHGIAKVINKLVMTTFFSVRYNSTWLYWLKLLRTF